MKSDGCSNRIIGERYSRWIHSKAVFVYQVGVSRDEDRIRARWH